MNSTLHELLDWHYGADGDSALRRMLEGGADPNVRDGPRRETPLHMAARRCRATACEILLDAGADLEARTTGGKTAFAHAIRRGFADVVEVLRARGADGELNVADRLAVALVEGRIEEAREIVAANPEVARTGNEEEDRLLADLAGRNEFDPVKLLIDAGADLTSPGLDGGTPLHQAAWFGQPANARLLIDSGAPLETFDPVHQSSPIGWAVHGSRFSGGAEEREDVYVTLVEMLLAAGAKLEYPNGAGGYLDRLLADAGPRVRTVLGGRS